MTIAKQEHDNIINDLHVGNSVAENDSLLEDARVETPVFNDVMNDKFDIVPGRKGAGKTAIFKIISILSDWLLRHRQIVILTGVDSAGEPIFNRFKDEFSKFTEDDFENFWKMYFVSLIYNGFIKSQKFEAGLRDCEDEIKKFKADCYQAGIPEIPAVQDKFQIISWIMQKFPHVTKVKNTTIHDTANPTLFTNTVEFELGKNEEKTEQERKSIYVNYIGDSLTKILQKSGFKIWVILDRLDEVFARYSPTEFNGLRGLLKAYKSFDAGQGSGSFRIKIFIRDDIKLFLTDAKIYQKFFSKRNIPPFAAATHVFSKEAPTLSWSEEEIQQLILNRFLLSRKLRDYLGITQKYENLDEGAIEKKVKEELRDQSIRSEYWDKIFPKKIQTMDSLKWIFTRLRDSNGVVTPRSVIDMLEAAINFLKKENLVAFKDRSEIFNTDSLKQGLDTASRHKLERDIFNEFPKEQENIKKLEKEGKPKLSKEELETIYGSGWLDVVEHLKRIGILRYIKNSDEYMIEFLFRPALNITYKYG